jgi:hypothetical protein
VLQNFTINAVDILVIDFYALHIRTIDAFEHIVTVFLACQITIKNVQVQLTVKGKTTPDSYTLTPKSSCAQNVVHRARIVQHFLQQEAVQTISWPAMSPDMNPIEHVWDFIGRKINQRNPKCQNIDELRTVILQEWQQFPQGRLRRIVRSLTRRATS